MKTTGIHHVTAIASDPQANLDYYTSVLGLRFVKRTVNFDDPGTYHFYFGDERGSPGTILTFFPYPGAARGRPGAGAVTATAFRVPPGSLEAWRERLLARGVTVVTPKSGPGEPWPDTRFGSRVLRFEDQDGAALELVESARAEREPAWAGAGAPPGIAIRGFHSVTLTVRRLGPTAELLTGVLGYRLSDSAGARARYTTDAAEPGSVIDVIADPAAPEVIPGAGIVHHVAVRARDDAEQRAWIDRLRHARVGATAVRDRTYFRSVYFREAGGVLFEIATDGPGFTADEPLDALGSDLKLPPGVESHRASLLAHLPGIRVPAADVPVLGEPEYVHRFEPGQGGATLVLLQGTGGSEHDLLPLGRRVAPGAALLAPRGDVDERGQLRFFKRVREGVFDQDDLRARTGRLATWLGAMTRRYGLGPSRLALVGFSNGANIAASMLLSGLTPARRAILIRPMIPFVPDPIPDLRDAHVLVLSGMEDPIVPASESMRLAELLGRAGASVEHHALEADHGLTARDLTLAGAWLRARGLVG